MPEQTIYTVGGTVQAGGGIYIKRKADDELLNHCRNGELAFVLSSRQVGKSSLMVRTAQQLENENIRSVTIDLSAIGVNVTQDEWYLGILNEIYNALNLKTDIFTWWNQYSQLGPAQRLMNFFRDVLLNEVETPIVLFFDEIDSTLSIPFSDDFYVALRAAYNARSTTPEFKRLSFVLVGVASPGDLISESKRTPFNIGSRVEIRDFTLNEALPLAEGLGEHAEDILKWIYEYTGGHPYLTQRVCAYLANSKETIDKEAVSNAIIRLFTGEQGKQDNNLQFVRSMLSKRSPDITRVLLIYRDVRSGKRVIDDERSVAKAHLKLAGLVRSEKGVLIVRNEIYNTVFNHQWIQENIPKNWTKIAAFSLGLVTFTLISILVYDFIVSNLSSRYVDNFYRSQIAATRLESLAKIFNLEGILPNADYDTRARDLFFSLNSNDQEALFKDPSPPVKDMYLGTVVRGLYVTMANVEGGQDSTALLTVIRDSLNNVDGSLYNEIDLWLQARETTTDQDALDKYNQAIQINNDNPATHYERAALEIKLGLFEEALADLDKTMALAINLSTEAAEREISTPTPIPTTTRVPPASTFALTVTSESGATSIVNTPTSTVTGITAAPITSQTPTPISTPTIPVVPEIPAAPSFRESYRSSFFSRAYIRSAVDLLMKKTISNPEFRDLLVAANYPDLASNGLISDSILIDSVVRLTVESAPTEYTAIGQVINFSFVVSNAGTSPLAGPVLITNDKMTITCPVVNLIGNQDQNLDGGETITCGGSYVITQADIDGGSVTDTARATVGGLLSNTVSTVISEADEALLILVVANPATYNQAGQQITYTYTIKNTQATSLGPAQFIVRDSRFPTPINCGPDTTVLATNQIVTCTTSSAITQADLDMPQITNSATASGAGAVTLQPAVVTIANNNFPVPVTTSISILEGSTFIQNGTISTPGWVRYVIIGSKKGEILSVRVTTPANDLSFAVYGQNGLTLKPLDATTSWTGTLTADSDYSIDIVSAHGSTNKGYTLDVTVSRPALASPISRVADINSGVNGSNPAYLSVYNGRLYFQADAGDDTGAELWRYESGLNAVSRFSDINLGSADSEPAFLTVYGDFLYFSANGNDGAGRELWRTNGVDVGRVTDINPGAGDANPMHMRVFNNILYFSANGNDGFGIELWQFDGTVASRVTDINPTAADSNPAYLAVFNNVLYFSATGNDGKGTELWKFDGTTSTRVSDINPDVGNSNPAYLTVFNNALYFSANDGTGTKFWRDDGTNPPTRLPDISGVANPVPMYLTVFNNALYFSANADDTGVELWKYDGTNFSRVADLNPAGEANPAFLTVYNGELYFQANGNDGAGAELWKYSGQ
jgi:ELWxxDGT repeat protein